MIAQLSPSAPRGRPSSSSIGVRCAGYFARYSGVVVFPQTSSSSKSRPAARTKTRTVRLFTLGLRMFSVCAGIAPPSALDKVRLVLAPVQAPPRDEVDAGLDDKYVANSLTDRIGEGAVRLGAFCE